MFRSLCLLSCFAATVFAQSTLDTEPIKAIERRVPPIGIEIPSDVADAASTRLAQISSELAKHADHPLAADIDVLLKAVRLAVEQRELYKPEHTKLLAKTLDLAESRLLQLDSNATADWLNAPLTVRGFYSRIDDSPQPYGLVIPEDLLDKLNAKEPVPLYVWLHGRGDKTTDIHFIRDRLTKRGQISPPNAIVLHPFGRQCIGYKSAGETDVLEAIEHVKANYAIDSARIVLMGFSMGGAGAWHLGAHYTDQFVAVSPGAGFAETSKYQKYTPEKIAATPEHERILWGVYDVPNYVRNFFNVPIVCYSGEKDKQIQAARVMEAAFEKEGRDLAHVIGPGMGHKYHPDSLSEIMTKMEVATSSGQPAVPKQVHLQTQTLRYSRMHWVQIDRLFAHWQDSRVDAHIDGDTIHCTTKNVKQLTIKPLPSEITKVVLDDKQLLITATNRESQSFTASRTNKAKNDWRSGSATSNSSLAKRPGLQGPIDDVFLDRFLVVTPSNRQSDDDLRAWAQFELDHLRSRWSALFRGKLPEKAANEVTADDIRNCHLLVFGDAKSNPVFGRIATALPREIQSGLADLRKTESDSSTVVQMIYPNPLNPAKYVVFNSGPTFREAHDRTNSLQNPKLPDWALIDLSEPPNAERAGRVLKAGFFDEDWQFQ